MKDARKLVAEWLRGRRRGYLIVGLLVLVTGAVGVARFAEHDSIAKHPAADSAAADSAEIVRDSLAEAQAFRVEIPPAARPGVVKGLYLNAWAAGSTKRLERLIGIANETEINTFVIDVKEGGEISYQSSVPLAVEIGASREYVPNIRTVLRKLRDNGIYPIARIVVFKDPVLANARPDLAVKNPDGSQWVDNKGKAWVDSYNREVWDYNIAIAREAVALGFAEVQWDYVRFADAPRSYLARAVYPAANGRTKSDAIREFLLYSRDKLKDVNVPITADVFGLTVTTTGDMGIGQQWEKMVDAVDVILPMVYPSHFISGNYGLSNPNAAPYRTLRRSMEDAVARSKPVTSAALIRPWLQAFTLGPPRYGPEHLRAQIQGTYDAGLKEWILWHPGSNYELYLPGLAPENGPEPVFTPPGAAPAVEAPKPDTVRVDTVRADTVRIDGTE